MYIYIYIYCISFNIKLQHVYRLHQAWVCLTPTRLLEKYHVILNITQQLFQPGTFVSFNFNSKFWLKL